VSVNLPTSMLFIDGTNLDHRLSEGIDTRDVDYTKLFATLSRGTQLLHTYFCTADYVQSQDPHRNEMRQRQQRALNRLGRMANVTVPKGQHRVRDSACRHCRGKLVTHVEKGTDVRAATLCVHAACMKRADRLILVANDNDFLPAIELSRDVGAHVTFAYVVASHSDHRDVRIMREAATEVLVIDSAFMDGIWLEKPPGSMPKK
jgi:uncharacterized LabA/DUF88 family protein